MKSRHRNAAQQDVALVMMDSRKPDLSFRPQKRLEMTTQTQAKLLTMFTYFLNAKYACRHGYTMLFFKLAGTDCAGRQCVVGCRHPVWGDRHPSYCKLCAIAAALEAGYGTVIYMDSDAFFQNTSLALPQLLSSHGAESNWQRPSSQPHVFFGWDS
eukprot:3746044-Prymnesium_polylepis.1